MSDTRELLMKIEREDTPTKSIWQRWKYEILVKHLKLTAIIVVAFCIFYAIGFGVVIAVLGAEKWAFGFFGVFICLWWAIKWTGIGIYFVVSRAFIAFLFAPLIYFIIKYFIHVDKVAFRELGAKNTHLFKITTTSDGYLLHEDKFFGLRKTPIYLDKATVQYFKENGSERVFKEKGKKDNAFLELDIVPLSWRGDPLLITDEETNKLFLNNAILVTETIRDYYALVVKGFSPSDRESEKGLIYDRVLETSDLKREVIQLKRNLKEIDLDRIELVAPVLIPSPSDEVLRFTGLLDTTTKTYDKIPKSTELLTSLLEQVIQKKESITDEEVARIVATEELD